MIHTKDIMLRHGMKIIRSASNNVIVANSRLSRCHNIPNYYSMASSLSTLSQNNNSLLSLSSSNTKNVMTITNDNEQTNITKRYMTVLSKQSKVEYKKSVSIILYYCQIEKR